MSDLNQCNFIGRLGKDPELRSMPNGDSVCNFSLACGWKSKSSEGTEWVNVVAFKQLAEICGKHLAKGSQVYISGKFRTRKWDDKEGVTRYTTEIVAQEMQMLARAAENGKGNAEHSQGSQNRTSARETGGKGDSGGSGFADFEGDVPF